MSYIRRSLKKSTSKVVAQQRRTPVRTPIVDDDSDVDSIDDSDDDDVHDINDESTYSTDAYGVDTYHSSNHSSNRSSDQSKLSGASGLPGPSGPLGSSGAYQPPRPRSETTGKNRRNEGESIGSTGSVRSHSHNSHSHSSSSRGTSHNHKNNRDHNRENEYEDDNSNNDSNNDSNNESNDDSSGEISPRRHLATIDEQSDEAESIGISAGIGTIRMEREHSSGEESGSGSESESDSSGSSESDSDTVSDSDTESSGSDSEEDGGGKMEETKFKDYEGGIMAQPLDVLNAIACALWEPTNDDESDKSGQESVSSGDSNNESLEGEGNIDMAQFSRQERDRAHIVFDHCATMDGKHLNEDQFGVALALLGQTEKKEVLKHLYDDLAISDGLSIDGFFTALNRMRTKGNEEEFLGRIQDAFDALYDGTCPKDDQKDFTGRRFIYGRELRLLLTTTGEDVERLTDEEANELLRECKPIYPKKKNIETGIEEDDGIAVAVLNGKIFFEQYRAMLLDDCP